MAGFYYSINNININGVIIAKEIMISAENVTINENYNLSLSEHIMTGIVDTNVDIYGDFLYTVNGGAVTILGFANESYAPNAVIPAQINGLPVRVIDTGAFVGTAVTSVSIPNSVTSIKDFAFDSSELESITFAQGGTDLSIGIAAFKNTQLTSITLPNHASTIEHGAFVSCEKLESISIGTGVSSIGISVFDGCEKLSSINAGNSNQDFRSVSGVLFNKEQTALIQYPSGHSRSQYTIPNTVTTIEAGAFKDAVNLTSVTIPDSVLKIGVSAFEGCTGLTRVTIPANVVEIQRDAFYGCDELVVIHFPAGADVEGYRKGVDGLDIYIVGGCDTCGDSVPCPRIDNCGAYQCMCGVSMFSAFSMSSSITKCSIHTNCKGEYALGNVNGSNENNGKNGREIFDFMEILQYLIGLDNLIEKCPKSFKAALIVSEKRPTIFDSIEILMCLVEVGEIRKYPTCTTGGISYCYLCDKDDNLKPLGHLWNIWKTTTKPTCHKDGEEERSCKRKNCNASMGNTIPASDSYHSYTNRVCYNDTNVYSNAIGAYVTCGALRKTSNSQFDYYMYRKGHHARYISCGWLGYDGHYAIDITNEHGTPTGTPKISIKGFPVYAQGMGVVVNKDYTSKGGNRIVITYNNGYTARYLHFDNPSNLNKGDPVNHTTIIGYTGSLGAQSTGPHLHLDVNDIDNYYDHDSRSLNPKNLFPSGTFD